MAKFHLVSAPSIFWITLIASIIILGIATLIGRLFSAFFPYRIKAAARFYMAPVFGLSTLTIIASLIGRFSCFGNAIIVPLIIAILIIGALIHENNIATALNHAAMVCAFGIFCGASIFGPLYVFGGFNAHNDAFTYLVHANWLQTHSFSDIISQQSVTPLTTQVMLYQQAGLRMGSSFLLALEQSLLHIKWSYEAYPALVISAITSCCLSIGFPLSGYFNPTRRSIRLALLSLPAFTLGGLVFGANLGFLPQTLGLALGAGLLFTVGPTLHWLKNTDVKANQVVMAALPAVVLLSSSVFAYSEMSPFLLTALGGSCILLLFLRNNKRILIFYIASIFLLSGLLLNTELLRTFKALWIQSHAVAGTPVDWPLAGFIAHSLGLHGGAWDGFQWTAPKMKDSIQFFLGLFLLCSVILILLINSRVISRASLSGTLMPVGLILLLFSIALLYFRYFVPAPFQKGVGQSWSQFKLSDWAHPFSMAFVILGSVSLIQKYRILERLIIPIFVFGFISALVTGVLRTTPLIQSYGGVHDLNHFYKEFRKTVLTQCPPNVPVYLSLHGQYQKFREMAVYYLPERQVASNWTDDGYFLRLPRERQIQKLNSGECVVEPKSSDGWLAHGTVIGPFRVGIFDGHGVIRITEVSGAYNRETDGNAWWYWVKHKVIFTLKSFNVSAKTAQSKLRFEYGTRCPQTLTIQVQTLNGSIKRFSFHSDKTAPVPFERIIDLPPSKIFKISIESDGQPRILGKSDPRLTSFIVRNLSVTPVIS